LHFREILQNHQVDFALHRPVSRHPAPCSPKARLRRAPRMMAPAIILGAMLMLVLWDTSEGG
jgi:hypothetical protein